MKAKSLLTALAAACAIALSAPGAQAASYSKASFTRLHNQVNVLKGDASPTAAKVGQEINTVSSVATGPDSRAELRFPDNSLTRIGANSRFTLRGDGRTLDLDSGVMMLQVPKKMGGAKVRTAAVTAAVTGTTVLFEYLPGGYVKLICVEGSVDLFLNSDPSQFRTINAGEMIIMKADGKSIPMPVDVDLATLLKTSKLISADDLGPNAQQINQALQQQQEQLKDGELVQTNLVIEGRGTLVSLNNDTRLNVFNNVTIRDNNPPTGGNQNPPGTGNSGNGGASSPTGPGFQGFAPLIAGTSVLNNTATVRTNPHVQAYNLLTGEVITSEGIRYKGLRDGSFAYFAFGSSEVVSPNLQPKLNEIVTHDGETEEREWALFKFEQLFLNGTPDFVVGSIVNFGPSENAIRDVILASQTNILVGDSSQFPDEEIPADAGGYTSPLCDGQTVFDLRWSGLENFVLYAQNGDVILRSASGTYALRGYNQNVSLVAAGAQNDVLIEGDVRLDSSSETVTAELDVIAGRDVKVTGVTVRADGINMESGQDVVVTNATVRAKQRDITVTAKRHINITDSSTLRVLSDYYNSSTIRLLTEQGDINITDSCIQGHTIELEAALGNINLQNTVTSGEVFKATTLGPNGWITIGGGTINANTLIQLYAEGANGGVRFTESATLNSNSVRIAGKTVEVVGGKLVSVPISTVIFSDKHNYNKAGYGNFSNTPGQYNFDARHASQ